MRDKADGAHRFGRRFLGHALVLLAVVATVSLQASPSNASVRNTGSSSHLIVGFNATTARAVDEAASLGVDTDVLYNGPPRPKSRLGRALIATHMTVVDGRISTELYFWECHRTHTVAPPPQGQGNDYCARDSEPTYDTAALLSAVQSTLRSDGTSPFTRAQWVLDDWPSWDGGSAQAVLQQIHEEIAAITPGVPAICGFGASVTVPGTTGWDPSVAENYSNAGCDMVGFYNYADAQSRPSDGSSLDWSMQTLLPAMESSLAAQGWSAATTPLLGIGQAWSGRLGGSYEPGLSASQVLAQASAFCGVGATSIAWYGWPTGGFRAAQTPLNTPQIQSGITQAVAACQDDWS